MEKLNIDCEYYMNHNQDLKLLCSKMPIADRSKFLTSHYERFGYKEGRKVRFIHVPNTLSISNVNNSHIITIKSDKADVKNNIDKADSANLESDLKHIDKFKRNFRKSIKY